MTAKKQRLDLSLPKPFNSQLSSSALKEPYSTSEPYLHGVISELFEPEFLSKVREELLQISFTQKETDIYRLAQSGDLVNLSELPAEQKAVLGHVTQLRDALYSESFRNFISDVTGCGSLSETKIDLSSNVYSKGDYLLNHDDVIGSRRISFILYLVDDGWQDEVSDMPSTLAQYIFERPTKKGDQFGGALQLYPLEDDKAIPSTTPSKTIPPRFNQFAFFTVLPGKSFHSVEEVAARKIDNGERDARLSARMSISGWFHFGDQKEYEEQRKESKSSLQQLYSSTLTPPTDFGVAASLAEALSDDEKAYLGRFLQPAYLEDTIVRVLSRKFYNDSKLVLDDFVRSDVASQIRLLTGELDRKGGISGTERFRESKGYDVAVIPPFETGVGDGWSVLGPPHIQRYCVFEGDDNATPTHPLLDLKALFSSQVFRKYLYILTKTTTLNYIVNARRFRPGLDYTLARGEPGTSSSSFLDVILDLSESSQGEEISGGFSVWLESDENTDEDVYNRDDDDSTLLTLEPSFNRLSIVLRDPGVLQFTKYMSSAAQHSRFDVYGEYKVDLGEDEEEEE